MTAGCQTDEQSQSCVPETAGYFLFVLSALKTEKKRQRFLFFFVCFAWIDKDTR